MHYFPILFIFLILFPEKSCFTAGSINVHKRLRFVPTHSNTSQIQVAILLQMQNCERT